MKIDFGSMLGNKYNRLTVESVFRGVRGRAFGSFRCDCGQLIRVVMSSVKFGHTKSCGCLVKEAAHRATHGKSRTPIYSVWNAMRKRCRNKNTKYYSLYGGRGIDYCQNWHTFENFYADMGSPPSKKHTLDRIDTNGNYCKENCRWALPKEQARNRRDNIVVSFMGNNFCITEACHLAGVTVSQVYSKRIRQNISPQEAFDKVLAGEDRRRKICNLG